MPNRGELQNYRVKRDLSFSSDFLCSRRGVAPPDSWHIGCLASYAGQQGRKAMRGGVGLGAAPEEEIYMPEIVSQSSTRGLAQKRRDPNWSDKGFFRAG